MTSIFLPFDLIHCKVRGTINLLKNLTEFYHELY
jgi:hypothetical protein